MESVKYLPKLRFREFEKHWKSQNLKDLIECYSGGTPLVGMKEYYDGDIPFIRSGEISQNSTALFISKKGLDNSSARLVNKGMILYALYGATSGEVSIAKLNGAINQAVLAIVPKAHAYNLFLAQWLRKSKEVITGMYLQGGQGNLSGAIVKSLVLHCPLLPEQTQIGNFFKTLDEKIALQEQKHEKLVQLKKAMLDKMFPKPGAKVPEIRFKGFTGDWEEKKLGELGYIITGSTPSTNDRDNYGGDFSFVSPFDINENRYIVNTKTTLSYKGFMMSRIVPANSVLFVSIGSTIGKVAQVKVDSVTNQQINSIVPGGHYDANFVYSLLEVTAPEIRKIASNQAVPIVNKTTFSEVVVLISENITEQQKIGEYFEKLDKLIAESTILIDKYKNIKQALLSKMFV